jgi:hypothetical protein
MHRENLMVNEGALQPRGKGAATDRLAPASDPLARLIQAAAHTRTRGDELDQLGRLQQPSPVAVVGCSGGASYDYGAI